MMAEKKTEDLNEVMTELKIVRSYLENFIKIIPEESLGEYSNGKEIEQAFQRSFRHSSE